MPLGAMVLRFLSAAVLVLGAISWPAVAAAAEPPPGSAVSQYVEVIPSATGGTVPRSSSPSASSPSAPAAVVLAPVVRKALAKQPAAQAKVLRDVATSPTYGAPQKRLRESGAGNAEATAQGTFPSPTAVAESGGPELPLLLVVVLGTAAALGGWAVYRRTSA
jgi:hypothetical protein